MSLHPSRTATQVMPEEAKQAPFTRKDVVRKATEVFVESNNQSVFRIYPGNADNMIEFRINADQYGDFSNCRLTFDLALNTPTTEVAPADGANMGGNEAQLTQLDKMMVEDFASVFKRMDVYVNSTLVDSINDFSALRAFLYYAVCDQDTYDTNLFNTEAAWQFRRDTRPGLRKTHSDGERALNQNRIKTETSQIGAATNTSAAFSRGTATNEGNGSSGLWNHTTPPQSNAPGQAFIATAATMANGKDGYDDGVVLLQNGPGASSLIKRDATSHVILNGLSTMSTVDGSVPTFGGQAFVAMESANTTTTCFLSGAAPNYYNHSARQLQPEVAGYVLPNRRIVSNSVGGQDCHIQHYDRNNEGLGVSLDFSNMSIFSSGKYLPLPHMNVTIQLFLVQKSTECVVYSDYPEVGITAAQLQAAETATGGPAFFARFHPATSGLASQPWYAAAPIVKISRPRFHYRSVELQPVYVNEVAGYLRSGQNMVIPFDSYYNVQQTWDGAGDVIVDMTKTYTNAKSLFWGIHHVSLGLSERTQTQFCRLPGWAGDYVDVGSGVLRIPQRADVDRNSECVAHLLKSLGLPKNHAAVALSERYSLDYIKPTIGETYADVYAANEAQDHQQDLGVVLGFSPGFQIDTWLRGYDLQKCHDSSITELCGLNTKDSNMSIKLKVGIEIDSGGANWTRSRYNTELQGPWNITVWTLHSRFLSIQSGLITVLD